jgi:hypothetical protein
MLCEGCAQNTNEKSREHTFEMLQTLLQRVVFRAEEGHHFESVVFACKKLLLHRVALR